MSEKEKTKNILFRLIGSVITFFLIAGFSSVVQAFFHKNFFDEQDYFSDHYFGVRQITANLREIIRSSRQPAF